MSYEENVEFSSRDNCLLISEDGELIQESASSLVIYRDDDEIVDVIEIGPGEFLPITVRDEKEVQILATLELLEKVDPFARQEFLKYLD